MPFQDHLRPSIQIGLLKSIVESSAFTCDSMHLNLDFAADIGVSHYADLFRHDCARGAGEWLFSLEAFGQDAPDPDGYFTRECRDQAAFGRHEWDELRAPRTTIVPQYLERLLTEIDWASYRVGGFTSTFAQPHSSRLTGTARATSRV